jgi:peptidoglycan biosynthesis protein MviN/MurJ (putative lipid II flippase)
MVVEIGSIVLLLREGAFAMRIAAIALAVSVALSWSGAHHLGLAGAASGSVIAVYLDRFFMLRRVSKHTGIALRELQPWRALAWTLVSAAAAAGLARLGVDALFAEQKPMLRLAAGAVLIALIYIPLNLKRITG